MKYLSTLLFALCLGWTWKIIHKQESVPFNTHAALQGKLAEIIANTIKNVKPESNNFKIDYLWTEILADGRIKAHFSYKFDDIDREKEVIENGLEGYAILEKEKSVAEQDDRWTVVEVKTNSGTLNFHEGLVITPNETNPATLSPTLPSSTPPTDNPATSGLSPTPLPSELPQAPSGH